MKKSSKDLNAISPAAYKISVVGVLAESYSDRLGGLSIHTTPSDQESGIPVTSLTGRLADQAALFGVLNALYNMHMPLLAVECIHIDEAKGETDEK
jgi:hypothetical protein